MKYDNPLEIIFEKLDSFGNILMTYREKFRLTAITSSLFFNFFLIYASWSGEREAWVTTYIIASIAIISALVCHITQPEEENQESDDDI